MSIVSVLIHLWRGCLLRTSGALAIASSRLLKLHEHFSCLNLLSQDECSFCLDSSVARLSTTNIWSFSYCLRSFPQAKRALPSSDLVSQVECSLSLAPALARQSITNISSFRYFLESCPQATRALPFSDLVSQDECGLFLDSLWRGSLLRPSGALDIASSRRIKLQELFLV
jgi:hypothetical protein